MPACQNCGHWVSERYVRVLSPPGVDAPRCCPHCEDKTRDRQNRPRANKNVEVSG